LVCDEIRAERPQIEGVGRREEEALQVRLFGLAEARHDRTLARLRVSRARERDAAACEFAVSDACDGRDALDHLRPREALRERDMELPQTRPGGRGNHRA
jgi:hypothetical protein